MSLAIASTPSGPSAATLDDGVAIFCRLRSRLLGVAARIVGSRADAEDIVQDAWIRWQLYDRTTVVNATAFLVTTTTRLAVNLAKSARARREACVGHWRLEPVAVADDPVVRAEREEALELGVQLLLDRLAAGERGAYVLHEAFEYPYLEIGQILETSEANARQLASRARKHLAVHRQPSATAAEHRQFVDALRAASGCGDLDDLEQLLAPRLSQISRRHGPTDHRSVSTSPTTTESR